MFFLRENPYQSIVIQQNEKSTQKDTDIILRSNHLPLKRFLEKNTRHLKVNNWAVEIEQYEIKFQYI